MPMNLPGLSPAGASLGVGGSIPGITGTAGLGDAMETDEERRKRLQQIEQQRSVLIQNSSPAASSLFGSPFAGLNGTGLLR
jgi:hypothetical protein